MVLGTLSLVSVAAAFVSIPLVRHRFGAAAKASAEAELDRQGVPVSVMAENGIGFDASGHETAAPVGIAAAMLALAGLVATGSGWADIVAWILLPLVLVGNALILYSNLTAVRSVRAAFARKGDPVLARIDVPALLKSAEDAFPGWVSTLQKARHTVVFGGASLALAAVAVV